MTKPDHCAENERIKQRYFRWLSEARGRSAATIDMAAAAIARFESYAGFRPFRKFHVEQARGFKMHLAKQGRRDGSATPLSRATIASTLRLLHAFFLWLADQPGYRSRIKPSEAAYFSPSDHDVRVAEGRREKQSPELADVLHVLSIMPASTPMERRDRAVVAFILLTGGRDGAVATLRLKHVDMPARKVFWDAREVRTKRAKTFTSGFFPVGDVPLAIVEDWVRFLQTEMGFGPDDPLFPASVVELGGDIGATIVRLSRNPWMTADPIREIFKRAFTAASLPYYNPHSLRATLARMGQAMCRTPEELKAWSQNLGHSDMLTTLTSYGTIATHRQLELVAAVGRPVAAEGGDAAILDKIKALIELQGTGGRGF